jgi:predicted outer membrane protein
MRIMWRGMMLAAAVAALPAGAAAQEASDDNDRAAHAFLSAVDLGEVQTSMLAMQRATNPEVRTYAQSKIADHANALHTREMLMQTENSGLLTGIQHAASNNGAGQLPPAYGPGNGNVSVEQVPTPGVPVANGAVQGGGGTGGLPEGMTMDMVQQLHAVLMQHPMSRPVMEASARNIQVLQGVNGPQFDVSYMEAQIGAQRYALSYMDRLLAQEGMLGGDIRNTLKQARIAVAAHLQTAEQIRGRLP